MRSRSVLALACAVVLGAAVLARGESTATLTDGQSIQGSVPPAEIIRLRMLLPEGGEPRLAFALAGSKLTLSFRRTELYDPDGNLIPDTSRYFAGTRPRPNRSVLRLAGFVTPKAGIYELVVETSASSIPNLGNLRATGKLRVKRPTRIVLDREETDLSFRVGLQLRDRMRVKVKRVSGDVPKVATYLSASGATFPDPAHKRTKDGEVAGWFNAIASGTHGFDFGYRDAGTAGQFRATVSIDPFRSRGVTQMALRNAPGIPLSVRKIDRSLALDFGSGSPGLSYDGSYFLISALRTGPGQPDIAARFYDRDLFPQPGTPTPVTLVGPTDMQPGALLDGFRALFGAGRHVVAWTANGAANAGIVSIRPDLNRAAARELVVNGPISRADPFLVSDGERISLGLFAGAGGHAVSVFDPDLVDVGTFAIGGGAYAHARGAGAAWNDEDDVFEFWAPDSSGGSSPSDLHRQFYSSLWQVRTPDATPVADPTVVETMCSAVAWDARSGVTIVHYVVPTDAVTGAGTLHRVLFDAAGVEVPGSHATLSGAQRNRPTSVIVDDYLFLGSSSPAGPVVERFPLLR